MPKDNKKEELLKALNALDPERLSKEDFVKAFESVVNIIVQIREEMGEAIRQLKQAHDTSTENTRNDSSKNITDLKKQVGELFVGDRIADMTNTQKSSFRKLEVLVKDLVSDKLLEVDNRMSLVKDGERGKQGVVGERGFTNSIDEKIIEDFKKEIRDLKRNMSNIPRGGGRIITGKYTHTPIVDRLTASTDGSTKTFTLSKAPKDVSTMEVFGTDFPIILDPTVDFTVSGKTLTLTDAVPAPSSGATLICKYYI